MQVIHKNFKISRIRNFYMRKVKFTQDSFDEKLGAILEEFPIIDVSTLFLVRRTRARGCGGQGDARGVSKECLASVCPVECADERSYSKSIRERFILSAGLAACGGYVFGYTHIGESRWAGAVAR